MSPSLRVWFGLIARDPDRFARFDRFSQRFIVELDEVGPGLLLAARYCRGSNDATYLQNSYADQQMAVLGIVVITLGLTPLKKPRTPSL